MFLRNFGLVLGTVLIMLTAALMSGEAFGSDQKTFNQTGLPQPSAPKPQFFCGYCHILTYPGIVQKGYALWKEGKHNNIGCVECHYPLSKNGGERQALLTRVAHIPKKPPERFSYLQLGGETVKARPRIADANCMT